MQVTLRAALMQALRDHALFPEIEIFDKSMGPLDLYQGSRLLAKITELCYTHLRRAKGKLIPEALQIPRIFKPITISLRPKCMSKFHVWINSFLH